MAPRAALGPLRRWLPTALPAALPAALVAGWLALAMAEARAAGPEPVFATVAGAVITQKDFDQAFAVAARNKFYHGKPPEADVARLQREVGDSLVTDQLLLREAKRRQLRPDAAAIQRELEGYEQRYRGSPMWEKNKTTMLPPLKKKLEENSLLDQLRQAVRVGGDPTDAEVLAYYREHPEKFTEPEQVRLSMILLKVDPSSPQAKWNGARDEGQAIVRRLRGGADFGQLARMHSGDASAERGGDMGYLHKGMLPEPAQQAVDKLGAAGGISEPVALLEGVAVFRLDDRKPARLNGFEKVKTRAHDLLQRDRADRAWTTLVERLKRETPAQVDESRFLPLALAPAAAK